MARCVGCLVAEQRHIVLVGTLPRPDSFSLLQPLGHQQIAGALGDGINPACQHLQHHALASGQRGNVVVGSLGGHQHTFAVGA